MCIQCKKLQKCLLMKAQAPNPLNSCVSRFSASLRIAVDAYIVRATTQIYTLPQQTSSLRGPQQAPTGWNFFSPQKTEKLNQIWQHYNWHSRFDTLPCPCTEFHMHVIKFNSTFQLPFKNQNQNHTQTHKSVIHLHSGWMPEWDGMLRQDQCPTGSPSSYVCVSFLDRKKHYLFKKSLNVLYHLLGLFFFRKSHLLLHIRCTVWVMFYKEIKTHK